VLERLLLLHAQLKVKSVFQTTAKLLREHQNDKGFPNKQANRVKYFIKFFFEKTTRRNERQICLQRLDCNALKFCGLSYKIKDMLELLSAEFNCLIAKVEDFIYVVKSFYNIYIARILFKPLKMANMLATGGRLLSCTQPHLHSRFS
jgi:hypothetical protein